MLEELTSRIAVYMRISTDDQKTDSQRLAIETYCRRNGIDHNQLVWFVDTVSSQTERSQWPQFAKMQEHVIRGRIDRIIVYHLDRVARKTQDGFNIVMEWLKLDVKLTVVTIDIDFTGLMGPVLAVFLFHLAEIDYNNRRERQRVGIAAAKARGAYKQQGTRKTGGNHGHRYYAASIAQMPKVIAMLERGIAATFIASTLDIAQSTVLRIKRDFESGDLWKDHRVQRAGVEAALQRERRRMDPEAVG